MALRKLVNISPRRSTSDKDSPRLCELNALRAEINDLTEQHRQARRARDRLPATDYQVTLSRVKRKPPPPLLEEGDTLPPPALPAKDHHDAPFSASVLASSISTGRIFVTVDGPPAEEAKAPTSDVATVSANDVLSTPTRSLSLSASSPSWQQKHQNTLPRQGGGGNGGRGKIVIRTIDTQPQVPKSRSPSCTLLTALQTLEPPEERRSLDPHRKTSMRPSLAMIYGRQELDRKLYHSYRYQRVSSIYSQSSRSSSHIDSCSYPPSPGASVDTVATVLCSPESSPTPRPHRSLFPTHFGKADSQRTTVDRRC